MNEFSEIENARPAFLGQKRRRNCEQVPEWAVFGALFEYFGPLFSKNDLFFAKIVSKYAVFDNFEKERVVFALTGEGVIIAPENKDLWVK